MGHAALYILVFSVDALAPLRAQDNTLRAWDMRPYAPANRCVKVFTGHSHTFEKNPLKCDWSPDGTKVRLWGWSCDWLYSPRSLNPLKCNWSLDGTKVRITPRMLATWLGLHYFS